MSTETRRSITEKTNTKTGRTDHDNKNDNLLLNALWRSYRSW